MSKFIVLLLFFIVNDSLFAREKLETEVKSTVLKILKINELLHKSFLKCYYLKWLETLQLL